MKRWLSLLVLLCLPVAFADEGMWTFNGFPSAKVAKKYGFSPDQAWLDHVRLSSVRLAGGCSASFVSPNGLVMTNHHCAHGCIEQLSTAQKDFVASGFYARTGADEVKCPDIEANQLVEITDVTDRINQATRGTSGEAFGRALKAEMARLEKACATAPDLRCDVVTLYHGGRYNLYKYRRFQDVRLVFAPEFAIAFFGGDPDNFMFPRYDLDVTFLRVYDDGKPAQVKNWFKWSANGVKEGDLTFVSGHPGSTSRLLTTAQLAFERDMQSISGLLYASEYRGQLTEFQRRGAEQARIANATLFYVENGIKARRGRLETLQSPEFQKAKATAERQLRARVAADPKLAKAYGGAWDAIAKAMDAYRPIYDRHNLVETGRGFNSELFGLARNLVRLADENAKPNEERLRPYTEANRPALEQGVFSEAPIYDEFEIFNLTFSLSKLRERLGVDDPLVKQVFGPKSPEELATELVKGSKLKDQAVRRALWDGGKAAIEKSDDPMIRFARLVDPAARAVRKQYEEQVESVVDRNSELVAKAAFAVQGTNTYPDATFTLRLSYGSVRGYTEPDGRKVHPITKIGGAFERATGRDPFRLPDSWIAAKPKLNLDTPFNMATDNDIIGGNSGSPVIDKNAEVVGLVFDGNIQSLGGDFWFEESVNRCVAVHSAALLEALTKIYGADRIVKELRP